VVPASRSAPALLLNQTRLPHLVTQSETPARTQSFLATLSRCRRRPSLLAFELLWRWLFGVPLLAVLALEGRRIWAHTGPAVLSTGVTDFSLQLPLKGAVAIAESYFILWPPIARVVLWMVPAAALAWALAAGLGRNLLLRRYSPSLPWRPLAMIALQVLRVAALCATWAAWFASLRWAAQATLSHITALSETAAEPSLVLYLALVIALTLAAVILWLLLSWIFSIAPLIALLERRGVAASLARSLRLGPLRGKLVEINLAMGYWKMALLMMMMVLTATPMAFIVAIQGLWLALWWAAVSLLYVVLSDFFQVARVIAYVELWNAYSPLAPGYDVELRP